MVDIPEIGLEKFAGSHCQISVKRLSHATEKTLHNVFYDLLGIHIGQSHAIHLTVEISFFVKDKLHRIDHPSHHHKDSLIWCLAVSLLHLSLQDLEYRLIFIRIHKILELIQNHYISHTLCQSKLLRKHHQFCNVVFIRLPVQRENLTGIYELDSVKHKMCPIQIGFHNRSIVVRS